MLYNNLENMFVKDFLTLLGDREQDLTFHITSSVLPDKEYAEFVGRLMATKELTLAFKELVKAYIPQI